MKTLLQDNIDSELLKYPVTCNTGPLIHQKTNVMWNKQISKHIVYIYRHPWTYLRIPFQKKPPLNPTLCVLEFNLLPTEQTYI